MSEPRAHRGSNIPPDSPADQIVYVTPQAQIRAFDKLPPLLRRRLANATINLNPIDAAQLLRDIRAAGYSTAAAFSAISTAIVETEEEVALGPMPAQRGAP